MHQNHKYAYSASNGWIGHQNTWERERERDRERDQCQTDDIDSSIDNFI